MEDKIFTMAKDGVLNPLAAKPFDEEKELQELIAEHPELLAWEQISPSGPLRWILVSREMGIAQDAGAGDRWRVDHLFIDHDAVPTLVEVKRGASPEIRRKVVGQVLEYAAHAWQTWTADSLRQTFEHESAESDAKLRRLVGVDDHDPDESWRDEFWQQVGANLVAKRLRLMFVADDIPDELTRIVEFLNAMMPDVEVLAVEIKKFDGHGIRTLVPRLIGRTAKLARAKRQKLGHDSFLAEFEDEVLRSAAERLLEVGSAHGRVYYGVSGVSIGTKQCSVAWIYPPGVPGWMRLEDFTFGCPLPKDVPAELHDVLGGWFSQFEDSGFRNVSGDWGKGWRVVAKNVPQHIDTLAERLERVLSELRTLGDP